MACRWNGFVMKTKSLDPGLWGRLPLDIQIKLLGYLPLPSLCRFQAVCRRWDHAVRSLKGVTVHGKCYIKTGEVKECLSICSTLEHGWLNLPFDYLPSDFRKSCFLVSACPTGLICFHSRSVGDRTIVSNLLTQSWRMLPELPQVKIPPGLGCIGMQTEDIGCSAFIVVFVRVGHGCQTFLQVFQSREAKWESSVIDLEAGEVFLGGALHGRTLYFLTMTSAGERSLRSIDVVQRGSCCNKLSSWTSLPLAMRQGEGDEDFSHYGSSAYHPKLVVSAGKILLVGEHPVTSPDATTVGLLIFNEKRKEWEPLASNPHWKDFKAGSYVAVVGCEDRVVVCDRYRYNCVYDMKTGAWSLLPEEPKLMWKIFPFELSFTGKLD